MTEAQGPTVPHDVGYYPYLSGQLLVLALAFAIAVAGYVAYRRGSLKSKTSRLLVVLVAGALVFVGLFYGYWDLL